MGLLRAAMVPPAECPPAEHHQGAMGHREALLQVVLLQVAMEALPVVARREDTDRHQGHRAVTVRQEAHLRDPTALRWLRRGVVRCWAALRAARTRN